MSFSLAIVTFVHVLLSLVGIGSGFVVVYEFLAARRRDIGTAIFLSSTVLTSFTGFLFPFEHYLPSHALGIVSLLVLGVAIVARYTFYLSGVWRPAYVVSSVIALYLNVFVLVVQLFQKVPVLRALAPKQSEPPFLVTQVLILGIFVALTIAAVIQFPKQPVHTA